MLERSFELLFHLKKPNPFRPVYLKNTTGTLKKLIGKDYTQDTWENSNPKSELGKWMMGTDTNV